MERRLDMDLDGPRFPPSGTVKPAQLVILLHGLGADGNDLIGLAPHWARLLPGTLFIAPHAPFPCDMAPFGYQWFSFQEFDPHVLRARIRATGPILDRFISRMLEEHRLSEDRLALVGFSQGCMMALQVAPRRQSPCAAVVGFSGALVDGVSLKEEIACRPPVLLVHGDADQLVPPASLSQAESGLRAVGITVEAHLRPGLGHGIDDWGLRRGGEFLVRNLNRGLAAPAEKSA